MVGDLYDAFAIRPISDLVMVLQKGHKRGGRKLPAWLAARLPSSKYGGLALVIKALHETSSQANDGLVDVVIVIAVLLASENHVQRVMKIIVPLRVIQMWQPLAPSIQIQGRIVIIFQHQVHIAAQVYGRPRDARQFMENVWFRVIEDCVNCVQSQTVEVEFNEPIKGIVYEKIPHGPAIRPREVDCVAPRSVKSTSEELWRISAQVITFRTKMVVDHVQEDHQSFLVCGLNEMLQI